MEKYDFIKLMLKSRNLSVNDKKRLIFLATQELEGKGWLENGNGEGKINPEPHPEFRKLPDGTRYINPANMYTFLLSFNQDKVLKYTCHDIDTSETIEEICQIGRVEQYSVESHARIINEHFQQLIDLMKEKKIWVDSKMYALMLAYLTGKDIKGETAKWSSLNIGINWCCEELLDWSKQNIGKVPSPGPNIKEKQDGLAYKMSRPLSSNLTGKRLLFFREVVTYFKNLFHIKRDNSLYDLICYANEKNNLSQEAEIKLDESSFKKNIELLTDVDKLIQAYVKIIKICVESSRNNSNGKSNESPIIQLSFYEEAENHIVFEIYHKNTVYCKTLNNTINRIGERHQDLIKNQINGLCDLFVEANFDGEMARVNLWDSHPQMIAEIITDRQIQGVKYILIFNQTNLLQ